MGPHPKRKTITLPRKATTPAPLPAVSMPITPTAPTPIVAPLSPLVRLEAEANAARARRKRAEADALTWLSREYPAAFGAAVVPLAIGVGQRSGFERRPKVRAPGG